MQSDFLFTTIVVAWYNYEKYNSNIGDVTVKKCESVLWILDRPQTEREELIRKYPNRKEYQTHIMAYEEGKYKQNIDFVHSLGLKCDSVGWCKLDLNRSDINEILDKIEEFCKRGNWLARGFYNCEYDGFESDW